MRLLAFALCVPLLTLACNNAKSLKDKAQNASRKIPTKLVLASNSEPDSLNPLFAEMAASHEVVFLGQRELTMYNDQWTLVPDLASEIPTLENGQAKLVATGEKDSKGKPKQKMVVTWRIKPDAVWEDGVPVTADDAIFAWQVCMDPTQEIIDRDTCERIESMKAEGADKKTLVVTWKTRFAFFNTYRCHPILPAHVLLTRYKKPGGGTKDLKKDSYGQHPLSNGPFKFKEWVPGQYITYIRNEKFKPLAKLEEVTIRIIPNNMSIESNVVAGTVDGTTPAGGLHVPEIEMLRKRQGDKFRYHIIPGMVWTHIDFNLDSPLLGDVRVRRAIAHAINRRKIIETIFHGKYEIANSFEPPLHWGYDKSIPEIAFDLKKAAELLDEAGFKQKAPGEIRTNAKGEALSLKISAVAAIKDTEQFQQVFQSDLRSIGVELMIDNKPAKVFFGDLARHRKFPHLSFYSWVSGPESWSQTLWHQNSIPSAKNNWQGQNYPGWKNQEASDLLDEIPTVLNEKERAKMLGRVQQLWFEALPAIPMYFRPVTAITRPDLQNYRPTGNITPVSWNAGEWTFDTAKANP